MKSYINTLADYREVPFEKDVTISCSKEYVESQLRHLTRNYKKTEAVETVENGDVVVLALESSLEKFNRPMLPLTVGKNLFDEAFEAQLIGHSVGEEFTVKVQEHDVAVTIKQASRTTFPQPTDEMAVEYAKEHDEFADIKTVEDYCNCIADKYIEDEKMNVIYGAMNTIIEYVLTHSDFEFDDEELNAIVNEEKEYIKEDIKEECHKSIEDLTEEELQYYFEISSIEEFDNFLQSGAEQRIATMLWIASVNGVDTKNASLQELEDNGVLNWDFLENFINETIKITEVR